MGHGTLYEMNVVALLGLLLTSLGIAWAGEVPLARSPWKTSLVAQAPEIRHPSVVACAPDGRVFVAEDPMDISRPAHAKEGRIRCIHPDGRITLFAEGLHAIFGMQYLEGRLYVLHNPKFSVFRDDNGVGKEPMDLIEQTNPNPWALDWNDHVPANFKLGMDGRFYVAVGDKGIYGAVGKDGRRADLHGGGILRLRPDGTELEVFSTGVRNILDVGLSSEDDIFTYDNTDENHWMGRVTQMVDGGFYGYPFDFIPQRPYTLWMFADYGAGAATGVETYRAGALPVEFADNLFLADFGQRNVRRVRLNRVGATFQATKDELLFLNPPGDFRPVGIAFSVDGYSLYVCDWQHRDSKAEVVTGRLWKVEWQGPRSHRTLPGWFVDAAQGSGNAGKFELPALIDGLRHPNHGVRLTAQRRLTERGPEVIPSLRFLLSSSSESLYSRIHALWALDGIDSQLASKVALELLQTSEPKPELRLARQLIRQIGESKYVEAVTVLVNQSASNDESIQFQAATAFGRLGKQGGIPALHALLKSPSLFVRHAAFRALERLGLTDGSLWATILQGFRSSDGLVREGILHSLRNVHDTKLIDALGAALAEPNQQGRAEITRALARCLGKTVPWRGEWWAYHPFRLSPPARTNRWEGSEKTLHLLISQLQDSLAEIREIAAVGLGTFQDDDGIKAMLERFDLETEPTTRNVLLKGLALSKNSAVRPLVIRLLKSFEPNSALDYDAVISMARAIGGEEMIDALSNVLQRGDERLLVPAIEALSESGSHRAQELLSRIAGESKEEGRIAAIRALGKLGGPNAAKLLTGYLSDSAPAIRRAAVQGLANIKSQDAIPALLTLWSSPESIPDVLHALAASPDIRALDAYLSGLGSKQISLRAACRKALTQIRDAAWPLLALKFKQQPPEVIAELHQVYRAHDAAVKAGLFSMESRRPERETFLAYALDNRGDAERGKKLFHDPSGVACASCHRVQGVGTEIGPDLSGIGAQFDRRGLAESILWPSRVVREGYHVIEVETSEEESISGMVRSENVDVLLIQPAVGPAVSIPKAKIRSRKGTPVSLMPEGLESALSLEDFADLLGYLESLRSGS